MRIALTLAVAFALAHTCHAQQMYRCGNTYSQKPCATDAKPVQLHSDAAADRSPGLKGYDLCAATAPSRVDTPEPETAVVQPLGPRKFEVIKFADQPLATHRFDLSVNVKTTYGVRSGPQAYSCWTSEDEAKILQFQPRRN